MQIIQKKGNLKFENFKKLQSIVNIFVFFITFMSNQSISLFLEKFFHPHPYCQIRGSQLKDWGGGFKLCQFTQ